MTAKNNASGTISGLNHEVGVVFAKERVFILIKGSGDMILTPQIRSNDNEEWFNLSPLHNHNLNEFPLPKNGKNVRVICTDYTSGEFEVQIDA